MPSPAQAEIHVGAEDWQANPEQVGRLAELLGIPVHVVPGNGHMLDHGYVDTVLSRWLTLERQP
jgi:hypothetical protein